jgi:hypothetical protein
VADNREGAAPAKPSLGGDLVLPAMGLAFTAYYFTSVWNLAWEAKANATVIGVVLLILIAIQCARVGARVLAGRADLGLAPLFAPRRVLGARLAVIAITTLFIIALPWLGLTLGLFAVVAALMLALGARSARAILLTAGCIAAGAYLLFIALLNSRLPRGPVEQLLSALF